MLEGSRRLYFDELLQVQNDVIQIILYHQLGNIFKIIANIVKTINI